MSKKNLSFDERFKVATQAVEEKRKKALIAAKEKTDTEQKLQDNAHAYLDYVENCIDRAAKEGYGSLEITIDRTYDMFNIVECPTTTYSYNYVVKKLLLRGYQLDQIEDHYDAISFLLTFLKNELFTTSPIKVGMYAK